MPTRTDPATAVKRYTLCGEPSAEARVAQDLSRIAAGLFAEIGDRMRALVLVGSFARAEGSVIMLDDEPYADPGYQLLALFDRKPMREEKRLADFAQTWTHLLRTRVDVRGFSTAALTQVPHTLFWFHVGCGQRVTLIGDPTAIFAVPPLTVSEIDSDEPLRVTTERTVALALTMLQRDVSPSTLADRLHDMALACGDAALLSSGHYHPSLNERAKLLRAEEPAPGLSELYDAATRHHADPHRSSPAREPGRADLLQLRARLCAIQLELEAQRIGSPRDPEAYARFQQGTQAAPKRLARVHALLRRAAPAPAAHRVLRAAVALAYDCENAAARATAARLLYRPEGAVSLSDRALADALRSLARRVLQDPAGRPFTHWRTEPRSLGLWLTQRMPRSAPRTAF